MMAVVAVLILAALSGGESPKDGAASVQSMLNEESADVFLAKATLQQYLSRVVRKDWDGTRRLTHPKALAAIEALRERSASAHHDLAPWDDRDDQLKTFEFRGSRQVAAGTVLMAVGEDVYHARRQAMSTGEPAVYILFKSHGGFLIGDKKAGAGLSEVSDASVRAGYPGWVDSQVRVQARRAETVRDRRHR
jgi:hypothetical protein